MIYQLKLDRSDERKELFAFDDGRVNDDDDNDDDGMVGSSLSLYQLHAAASCGRMLSTIM